MVVYIGGPCCEAMLRFMKTWEVEVSVAKKQIESETNALAGEYVNESTLATIHGWDEILGLNVTCFMTPATHM